MTLDELKALGPFADELLNAFYWVDPVLGLDEQGKPKLAGYPYGKHVDHLRAHLEGMIFPPDEAHQFLSESGWVAAQTWFNGLDELMFAKAAQVLHQRLIDKNNTLRQQSKLVEAEHVASVQTKIEQQNKTDAVLRRAEHLLDQQQARIQELERYASGLEAEVKALQLSLKPFAHQTQSGGVAKEVVTGALAGYALGRLL